MQHRHRKISTYLGLLGEDFLAFLMRLVRLKEATKVVEKSKDSGYSLVSVFYERSCC
jgi:hypothetical protein